MEVVWEREFLMKIKMRNETIEIKMGGLDHSADWARLSSIKYVKAWGNTFAYYIEVSKTGTETRAVILGGPTSEKYENELGVIVRDFKPVDYYNAGLKAKISEELRRSNEKIKFV